MCTVYTLYVGVRRYALKRRAKYYTKRPSPIYNTRNNYFSNLNSPCQYRNYTYFTRSVGDVLNARVTRYVLHAVLHYISLHYSSATKTHHAASYVTSSCIQYNSVGGGFQFIHDGRLDKTANGHCEFSVII